MSSVQTVNGPVNVAELGRILPHEHLLSLLPIEWELGDSAEVRVSLAVKALEGLAQHGFRAVVDLSPYGVVGRDAEGTNVTLLQEVSSRSGLHIISGTALYLESYAPSWARTADENEIFARFVRDAEQGIGGTTVRAGIYGEQATSLGEITDFERRVLRAMGRAQRETGLAIMTHTTHGTMALEQIDLLESVGADLSRVVIGHMDTHLDHRLVHRVLSRGVTVSIDTIGKQDWDFFLGPAAIGRAQGEYGKRAFHRADTGRADLVAELVAAGHADRVFLAQDLTGAEIWMNPLTHGRLAYSYLPEVFIPMLEARGVDALAIEQMTAINPRSVLELA